MTEANNIRQIGTISNRIVEQVARQSIEVAQKDGDTQKAARLQHILDDYLAGLEDDAWPF